MNPTFKMWGSWSTYRKTGKHHEIVISTLVNLDDRKIKMVIDILKEEKVDATTVTDVKVKCR